MKQFISSDRRGNSLSTGETAAVSGTKAFSVDPLLTLVYDLPN